MPDRAELRLAHLEAAHTRLRPTLIDLQCRGARGEIEDPSLLPELLRRDARMTELMRELRLRISERPGLSAWVELDRAWSSLRLATLRLLDRARTTAPAPERLSA